MLTAINGDLLKSENISTLTNLKLNIGDMAAIFVATF